MYVTPPMGDEGLTLGAVLMYNAKHGEQSVFRFDDVYLGSRYTDEQIISTFEMDKFKSFKSKIEYEPLNIEKVSQLLCDGHIVGLFQGRMEYGPRALGNRTILADPRGSDIYNKLNGRLHRNDCMPFAPVVLDDHVETVFDVKKSKYTAEFMTMLYDTHPEWHDKIPAAVHPIDKTARIQIVREKNNPKLHSILQSFYNRTGVPVLINTSFNVHEEPIVCWPENALDHLINGIVDYLIIEDRLVYLKK